MNSEIHGRLFWCRVVITLGLLCGMLISWKLWVGERLFPHLPMIELFPPPALWFERLVVLALIASLGIGLFFRNRVFPVLSFGLMFLLCASDQMRLQPWFYQYGIMLLPFIALGKDQSEKNLFACIAMQRWVIAGVYIWGGLHKAHPGFMELWETVLLKPLQNIDVPEVIWESLVYFGHFVPWIELLTGVFLLIPKLRKTGVLLVLLTHLSILILIGCLKGYYSNVVVWPWNAAMVALVLLLFLRSEMGSFYLPDNLQGKGLAGLILILMTLSPCLYYVNLWDRYLAFNLYSARQRQLYVKIDERMLEHFPAEFESYLLKTVGEDGHRVLSVSRWATRELNVPFVSERRLIRSLSRKLVNRYDGSFGLTFWVRYPYLKDQEEALYRGYEVEKVRIP